MNTERTLREMRSRIRKEAKGSDPFALETAWRYETFLLQDYLFREYGVRTVDYVDELAVIDFNGHDDIDALMAEARVAIKPEMDWLLSRIGGRK